MTKKLAKNRKRQSSREARRDQGSTGPERVSDAVRQLVLLEAGYRCANPVCRQILALDVHHIEWVKENGENAPRNLLALCPTCHALHTRGEIPKTAIVVWKAMLLSINNANRANLDILLHLYEQERRGLAERIPHGADAVLQLAGLITSDLLSAELLEASSGGMGHAPYAVFRVRLTEKGRALIEAAINRSEHEFRNALALPRRR